MAIRLVIVALVFVVSASVREEAAEAAALDTSNFMEKVNDTLGSFDAASPRAGESTGKPEWDAKYAFEHDDFEEDVLQVGDVVVVETNAHAPSVHNGRRGSIAKILRSDPDDPVPYKVEFDDDGLENRADWLGAKALKKALPDGLAVNCGKQRANVATMREERRMTPESTRADPCGFYMNCLDKRLKCSKSNYALDYGHRFCSAFGRNSPGFSDDGKQWLADTMACLQNALVPFMDIPEDGLDGDGASDEYCAYVQQKAFRSHAACYTGTVPGHELDAPKRGRSVCFLSIADMSNVVGVVSGVGAGFRNVSSAPPAHERGRAGDIFDMNAISQELQTANICRSQLWNHGLFSGSNPHGLDDRFNQLDALGNLDEEALGAARLDGAKLHALEDLDAAENYWLTHGL